MPKQEYQFEVAFSFAGDGKRDRVKEVARLVEKSVGEGKVFFDDFFNAELPGMDGQTYLQNIYRQKTRLVVVCLCHRYNEKPWYETTSKSPPIKVEDESWRKKKSTLANLVLGGSGSHQRAYPSSII